jgi:hypothetical protein
VLRILLFHEQWLGPPDAELMSSDPAALKPLATPCTQLPRLEPAKMQVSCAGCVGRAVAAALKKCVLPTRWGTRQAFRGALQRLRH